LPDISILIPVHADTPQKVGWLAEALESLKAQTFVDFEVLIVDDLSPLSLDAVKADTDGRFRWFRTSELSGPARCRNTAANLARAEALLALDADDRLAEPETLEVYFEAWRNDQKRVVYGDIQRLEASKDGSFNLSKVFNLPEYTFEGVMRLNGIIPVTAMHSKECHLAAGGWKPELDAGLEDIEYWIAAGKGGFCGHRIDAVTLLYRRHEQSRAFKLRRVNRRESEMRNAIRMLHRDVYEGRFPMGCCSGGSSGGSGQPALASARASTTASQPTTLDQFAGSEKVWVQYNGKRMAAFGVTGVFTGMSYKVDGPGHKLEVHVNDVSKFRRAGRGKDFAVGVAAPTTGVPDMPGEPPVEEQPPEPYKAPDVQLATIERLDAIGHGREPRPRQPQPEPEPSLEPEPQGGPGSLASLDLGNLAGMLERDGWTVEALATAEVDELISYRGVGPVRASQVIGKARDKLGMKREAA